jgi:hypothetical protein
MIVVLRNALPREDASGGISSREAHLAIQSAIGAASSPFLWRASRHRVIGSAVTNDVGALLPTETCELAPACIK